MEVFGFFQKRGELTEGTGRLELSPRTDTLRPENASTDELGTVDGSLPKFKRDGGHRLPENARLAHIRCNDLDYKWSELPEGKRPAAVERWRKKYMGDSSNDR